MIVGKQYGFVLTACGFVGQIEKKHDTTLSCSFRAENRLISQSVFIEQLLAISVYDLRNSAHACSTLN